MKAVCKKLNTITFKVAPLAAAVMLSACGGSGQDKYTGSGDFSSGGTLFSGAAIDGALARATVYLDTNNNATRDPWEDFAFTDNDGYYSFNPKTNTDYCAADAPDSEKIYCLKSSRSFSNVVVRVDGGYDLLTGEPFLGQMSRRVELEENESSKDSVVSPLTTLLTDVESDEDRDSLLNALQIQKEDLDVNYLDSDGDGAIHTGLLNKALKVHKTVTVLSDRLSDNYEALGDQTGVMNDPSSAVYKNMALELIGSDNTVGEALDNVLKNPQVLSRIMDTSESILRELYESKDLDLPQDMGDSQNPGGFNRVVEIAQSIPDVVDQLLSSDESFSFEEAVGNARALESLVIKAVTEGPQEDSSIDDAVDFFTSEETEDLVDALTESLSSDLADVTSLASSGFGFGSVEEIEEVAVLPEGSDAFTSMVGMQLRVSDLYLGTQNALRDIELEAYFTGSEGAIAGTFTACAKYIEDALPDGTLGDGNTHGELISGFWSMLGATENDPESYSILMTLEFLGATYQAIMKTVGTTTIDGVEYQQIRFDNSGEYKIWHSLNGVEAAESVPTTVSECEQRLPSRVGL